jgi:aminoglycoside 6'-N-acetyltransferase I
MNYTIRRFEEKDEQKVAEMMVESFRSEPWRETWTREQCQERIHILTQALSSVSYVLMDEKGDICGAALGYTLPYMDKKEYELQEFFISSRLQHLHIGSFFMKEFLNEIKKEGIDQIRFYTSGNLCNFYSKFGFRKSETDYMMEGEISD